MKGEGQLLPEHHRIKRMQLGTPLEPGANSLLTRDHEVIRRWAAKRHAEPATGEATSTGPATVNVNDGGAGIRFNFPGTSVYRPISWDEWLGNFDDNDCAFVYEEDSSGPMSNRYRIVKAADWRDLIR